MMDSPAAIRGLGPRPDGLPGHLALYQQPRVRPAPGRPLTGGHGAHGGRRCRLTQSTLAGKADGASNGRPRKASMPADAHRAHLGLTVINPLPPRGVVAVDQAFLAREREPLTATGSYDVLQPRPRPMAEPGAPRRRPAGLARACCRSGGSSTEAEPRAPTKRVPATRAPGAQFFAAPRPCPGR